MSPKDIPTQFSIDSEEDLRMAVARYFIDLGFDSDEMSFEDRFQVRLGHKEIVVDKNLKRNDVSGRSDLLLTRSGRALAIVETKSPEHDLTDEDAQQAISYARLLREMAPYAIVTNGRVTRVYDTVTGKLEPIESPLESTWAENGQRWVSIGEDLRYEACRTLIGVNPETLRSFCESQVSTGLLGLKGDINEQKKYIPGVYVPREGLDQAVENWLSSNVPFFAAIGESGFGKTNVMCASAEALLSKEYVLFYRGTRLVAGILDAIANDFIWEFHREKDPAHILDRFDHICRGSGRKLIVFIDGLDEYNGNLDDLKSELIDVSNRLRGLSSIRLCISCKLFDWPRFVIDNGQSYNELAISIYPQRSEVLQPETILEPKAEKVGILLAEFTDAELAQAIEVFTTAYAIQGEFKGDLRAECHNPLMLRFVAEVYGGKGMDLPYDITSKKIFDLYWNRRLNETGHKNAAEQILVVVAEKAFRTERRQVLVNDVVSSLQWSDEYQDAFSALLRMGVLMVNRDANSYEWVSFYFGKLLLYTYTLKVRRWPLLSDHCDVARQILDVIGSRLGREAIEFYISTIDRGESPVLTELACLDLRVFVHVVTKLNVDCKLTAALSGESLDRAVGSRMVQYAECYSALVEKYLAPQRVKIEPLGEGKIGIWTDGRMWQLRTRSEAYPDPVVFVSDEIVQMIWNRKVPARLNRDLQPGGTLHLGLTEFNESVPQKAVWKKLDDQLGRLFSRRMLDESGCPYILEERIWDLLQSRPSTWFGQAPSPRWKFWRLLGFDEIAELEGAGIDVVLTGVDRLIGEFESRIPGDRSVQHYNDTQRWYYIHIQDLWLLKYWLGKLSQHQTVLGSQPFLPEELFAYLRASNLEPAGEQLRQLLPHIIDAYQVLFEDNFPGLAGLSEFSENLKYLALVELGRSRSYGDFLGVSYVVCPSIDPRESPLVMVAGNQALMHQMELCRDTLGGHIRENGGHFGYGAISVKFEGSEIEEPRAIINRTRYPSRTPVTDQVHQLIGNELKVLFGDNFMAWANLDSGTTDKKAMMRWVLSELYDSRKP